MWVQFLLLALALLALGLVVFPDVGCEDALNDYISDRLNTGKYYFRVFTNNVSPGTGSVAGSFTEATWAGYAPVVSNTITFGPVTLVGHVASVTGSAIVFPNTSGVSQTAYGIFVTDSTGLVLYYAERDPAAPVSVPNGGQYIYTPNLQLKSIN